MSASRDNLPVVPEETKPPTLPGVLWQLAGLIFKREALMLVAAVAILVGAGGATVVYGQGYLDGGMAPIKAEMVKRDVATNARIDAIDRKFDATEERNARRFEVLYNTMLTGRPQPGAEELKKPAVEPKDGG